MDPLLILLNVIVALIGLFLVWIAWRLQKIGERPHKASIPTFIAAAILVLLGVGGLPSVILQAIIGENASASTDVAAPTPIVPSPEEPAIIDGGPDGQTIIITHDQDLVALLKRAIEGPAEVSTPRIERDSVAAADDDDSAETELVITDDDSAPETAPVAHQVEPVVMEASTPPPRARIRMLPTEPEGDRPPLCSGFTLIHGPSGGPDLSGCHVVGCAQGYALPMRHVPGGGWELCTNPSRVERIDQCYVVPDADGTESGRTFKDGSWVKCPVT